MIDTPPFKTVDRILRILLYYPLRHILIREENGFLHRVVEESDSLTEALRKVEGA